MHPALGQDHFLPEGVQMASKTKTTSIQLSAASDPAHTTVLASVSEQHLKAPYYRRCTLVDVLSQALAVLATERGERTRSECRKTNPNGRFLT